MSYSDSAFTEGDEEGWVNPEEFKAWWNTVKRLSPSYGSSPNWGNFGLFFWDISIKAKHAFLFKVSV